jgi:hypothetical protein
VRDESRIDLMLEELRTLWKMYPDMRLGQLIYVLVPHNMDIFNFEDDRMLEEIREKIEIFRKRG